MFGVGYLSFVGIIGKDVNGPKISECLNTIGAHSHHIITTKRTEIIGISRRAIAKQIDNLKTNNKLRRIGPGKGGYWEVVND